MYWPPIAVATDDCGRSRRAVTSNFRERKHSSIFGTANGQGLGNMTYQWQVSSSPAEYEPGQRDQWVTYPAPRLPVITFTSAQTTDSGYYHA